MMYFTVDVFGSWEFVSGSVIKVKCVWRGNVKLGSLPAAPLAVCVLKQHKDISEHSSDHVSHPLRPIICFFRLKHATLNFPLSLKEKQTNKQNKRYRGNEQIQMSGTSELLLFLSVTSKGCLPVNMNTQKTHKPSLSFLTGEILITLLKFCGRAASQ